MPVILIATNIYTTTYTQYIVHIPTSTYTSIYLITYTQYIYYPVHIPVYILLHIPVYILVHIPVHIPSTYPSTYTQYMYTYQYIYPVHVLGICTSKYYRYDRHHVTFSVREANPFVGWCVLRSYILNFDSNVVATSLFIGISFLSNSTPQTY